MSVLPEVSELKAIQYEYFPTVWQNVVWRNWGYVPIERLMKILGASREELKSARGTRKRNMGEMRIHYVDS